MQQYAKSVSRDAEQKNAYGEIVELLTGNGVSLLPIKGIELKNYYPASYMRQMADVDIAYDSHGNDKKVRSLMESLGYSCESWGGGHHDIFHRPPITNIELHRRANYPEYFEAPGGLLPDSRINGLYHLSPEDLYILLLKHDARHMKSGGLGVRAICDIYVLRKQFGKALESGYVKARLSEYGLEKFAGKLNEIASDWFGGSEPVINRKGRIILSGHTYGSASDTEMLKLVNANKGSKLRYILKKILPGINIMKTRYGILDRLPFLLPLCWILRAFEILFDKKRLHNLRTYYKIALCNEKDMKQYNLMIDEFGLDCIK
jgi:hypothetical protein